MLAERSPLSENSDDPVIIDITPAGISKLIQHINRTGLDVYKYNQTEEQRTTTIIERRPFIAKLDSTLRALKAEYPKESINKKRRQPNREYRKASYRLNEYRKQVSSVQRADRLTIQGKLKPLQ